MWTTPMYRLVPCVLVALLLALARRYGPQLIMEAVQTPLPEIQAAKPVVFPDPAGAAVRGENLALLPLPRLIELKLASGMTAPHRLKDLADVLEVIRVLKLPAGLAEELDPYVREKYAELWQAAQAVERE